MSSIIEQAALRLEQLKQAGISLPDIEGEISTAEALREPRPTTVPVSGPQVSFDPGAQATLARRVELNLAALEAAGILTPHAPRSSMADEYRVIKRPLISNALNRGAALVTHGNLIMITSALAGEGKTYSSVNLAMSIASELDHTVMLVDADVARPSVLKLLGLPPGPGLLDVLEGKADVPSVLLRTNVDKLTILPSGTPHPRATELLASDAMTSLLEDLATRYSDRIVIFDSPPLLLTTESRVLATHMGQIVVVVQAGRTAQSDVMHALSTIESCPVRMMMLNKARTDGPAGYGYGYGHGYGFGYGYGKPEAIDAALAAAPAESGKAA